MLCKKWSPLSHHCVSNFLSPISIACKTFWCNKHHYTCIIYQISRVTCNNIRGLVQMNFGESEHGKYTYQWSLGFESYLKFSNALLYHTWSTFVQNKSWWRHQMETFSVWLAYCEGNSLVTGEFPSQRPVTRSFDVFFDLHPNKRLSEPSRRRWFWDAIALIIMTSP